MEKELEELIKSLEAMLIAYIKRGNGQKAEETRQKIAGVKLALEIVKRWDTSTK